jgi:RNA polymerase sporulation-specific sigma factor
LSIIYYPAPLPNSETTELFKQLRESNDIKIRNQLVVHNMRLCVHIAQKYLNISDLDEITEIATLGLIKAVDSFDYAKGVKFAAYASRCITNEILMFARKNNREQNMLSLEDIISTDKDGNTITWSDVIPDPDDGISGLLEKYAKEADLDTIVRVGKRLSDVERTVLHCCLHDPPLIQQDIARQLGMSQSCISRVRAKMLKKLRRVLCESS